ncbi:hypothetical protein BSKO_12407 [Bryopsis sp. KO-2023]|nr:hypothetical protein BSKO_12407 [Bryopsis sp. KO-2023]
MFDREPSLRPLLEPYDKTRLMKSIQLRRDAAGTPEEVPGQEEEPKPVQRGRRVNIRELIRKRREAKRSPSLDDGPTKKAIQRGLGKSSEP